MEKHLKFNVMIPALLGLVLRFALYATGVDGRGLLEEFHPARILLWGLTVLIVLLLLPATRKLPKDGESRLSPLAPLGTFPLAAVLLFSGILSLIEEPKFLDLVGAYLTLAAGICLIVAGVFEMLKKRPHWLLFSVVCVFFTFRTVCQYRAWCTHPQLMDYFFYLCGHLCLMFTAYYHAADAARMGSPRLMWLFSLGAVFFCLTAIPASGEWLMLVAGTMWAFFGLPEDAA